MRKLFGLLVAVTFVFAAGVSFSQDAAPVAAPATTEVAAPAAPAADVVAPAVAEFAGVIEVIAADAAKNETAATIVLKVADKSMKLVCDDAAKLAELEKAAGKNVTVKGTLVAATEGAMESIQVAEWAEVVAPAATETPAAAPAATEAPAAGN